MFLQEKYIYIYIKNTYKIYTLYILFIYLYDMFVGEGEETWH